MEKEVLKRYFERTSSVAEIQAVEDWLLDPANKLAFENFLEEEWDEYTKGTKETRVIDLGKPRGRLIRKVVSAAALALVTLGAYFGWYAPAQKEPADVPIDHARQAMEEAAPVSSTNPPHVSDTLMNVQPKTVQHAKKKVLPSAPAIAKTAENSVPKSQKVVKTTPFSDIKINERHLATLVGKIDSNQLVLNMDFNKAGIRKFAQILRDEYGILLEPNHDYPLSEKMYTAKFEKISVSELLNDMSEKMAFSYSFQDSVVKIHFN